MATDPQNPQYDPGQSKFFAAVPQSTGAPGSQGVADAPPGEGGGAVIARPAISTPYASSQIEANRPTVPVVQGDTSGMSSDAPVPPSGDPLTGLSLDVLTSTGAGRGRAGHFAHPSSQNGGAA